MHGPPSKAVVDVCECGHGREDHAAGGGPCTRRDCECWEFGRVRADQTEGESTNELQDDRQHTA